MFNHEKLRCYGMALDVAKSMPALITSWPTGSHYLADQLRRAVASIVLNISEGNAKKSLKDRARFFAIARGSAAESAAAIDIASALRLIAEKDALYIKDRLLQIVKMLYKLR